MLKEMTYSGYEILDTSFSLSDNIQKNCFYQFQIRPADEFKFLEIFDRSKEHTHNEISILFHAFVQGFSYNGNTPLYTLKINYLIRFMLSKNRFVEKQLINHHFPFFMRFAHHAAKSLIDSVLMYNAIPGTLRPDPGNTD
ncbi:hypothetical protein [Vibrio quintilis]|uniref:Uncharacterized protein n=1 Tax=Vibrio quintilis TaxID=1117707 RepID=A0A1M7Z0T6_9VIBR|nr:hypothetical protein [Vibrio quintilis]SHO58548.1 hypothetical protein VQ7734_04320 [Vibrio quintilis]